MGNWSKLAWPAGDVELATSVVLGDELAGDAGACGAGRAGLEMACFCPAGGGDDATWTAEKVAAKSLTAEFRGWLLAIT